MDLGHPRTTAGCPLIFNMKRYYIPKEITLANVAAPLLVVSGNWYKWFNNATKAKRSTPPVGRPTGRQRRTRLGWVFSTTDDYGPRLIHSTHLEVNPNYLAQALTRLLYGVNPRFTPANTSSIVYSYMLIPAPDYARLKTNHKIGAPKGRLP